MTYLAGPYIRGSDRLFGMRLAMKPQHHLDKCIMHPNEEPPRMDHCETWYVDAQGYKYTGKDLTPATADIPLRESLDAHGIPYSSLPAVVRRFSI